MEGRASRPRTFVIYDPAYERYGNNVPTALRRRYDAFLRLGETRTPRPLHAPWSGEQEESQRPSPPRSRRTRMCGRVGSSGSLPATGWWARVARRSHARALSGPSGWWQRNAPVQAERYRVFLLDLPGFGAMRR